MISLTEKKWRDTFRLIYIQHKDIMYSMYLLSLPEVKMINHMNDIHMIVSILHNETKHVRQQIPLFIQIDFKILHVYTFCLQSTPKS